MARKKKKKKHLHRTSSATSLAGREAGGHRRKEVTRREENGVRLPLYECSNGSDGGLVTWRPLKLFPAWSHLREKIHCSKCSLYQLPVPKILSRTITIRLTLQVPERPGNGTYLNSSLGGICIFLRGTWSTETKGTASPVKGRHSN